MGGLVGGAKGGRGTSVSTMDMADLPRAVARGQVQGVPQGLLEVIAGQNARKVPAFLQGTPFGDYMANPAKYGGQFNNMEMLLPWLLKQYSQRQQPAQTPVPVPAPASPMPAAQPAYSPFPAFTPSFMLGGADARDLVNSRISTLLSRPMNFTPSLPGKK